MAVSLQQVIAFSPVYIFHESERFFPCSIEFLLEGSTLCAPDGSVIKTSPEPADLAANDPSFGSGRRVVIDQSRFPGQSVQAGTGAPPPLYYAVQDFDDGVTRIHYISLYAYQGSQTCRAKPPARSGFDVIVNSYGSHQGDIERVAVILKETGGGNHAALAVEYEAHGETRVYSAAQVPWLQAAPTHPMVHVALNGHSHHNLLRQANPVVEASEPAVDIVSACADNGGIEWAPFRNGDFRQLGLDGSGNPIGPEVWSPFRGRLGAKQTNSLQSATHFDGSNLSSDDWSFVSVVDWIANLFDVYPEDIAHGDGPQGPGVRDWVRSPGGAFLSPALTVLNSTPDLGQGTPAITWQTGRFIDVGRDFAAQFWSNGGCVAVILYGMLEDGTIGAVSSKPNLGQGDGAIQWLTGRFFGGALEQVAQCWDNDGRLGLILYGSDQAGGLTCLWSTADIGHGSDYVGWAVGDFDGSGQDKIAQLWDSGGNTLGITLYGSDGAGGLEATWSSANMGQGAGADTWLVGDFDGSGRDKIAQLWDSGGNTLAIILYGTDGAGGLQMTWQSDDMGQGIGANQWLLGDFDGSGAQKIAQLWDSGGNTLAMILYGSDGTGGLRTLWWSNDMGQGLGAECWTVGDYDGDGADEILQCWSDGGVLAMIMYGADCDGDLEEVWSSRDLGENAAAVSWAAGKFGTGTRNRLLQFWDNGNLAVIQYGSIIPG